MDEREAEYLRQYIRDLEHSNRRWKVVTFSLLVLLTILIIPGALVLVGLSAQRMARLEAEQARMEAERAAQQARQAERLAHQPQANPAGGGITEGTKGTKAQPAQQAPDKTAGDRTPKAGAGGQPPGDASAP